MDSTICHDSVINVAHTVSHNNKQSFSAVFTGCTYGLPVSHHMRPRSGLYLWLIIKFKKNLKMKTASSFKLAALCSFKTDNAFQVLDYEIAFSNS